MMSNCSDLAYCQCHEFLVIVHCDIKKCGYLIITGLRWQTKEEKRYLFIFALIYNHSHSLRKRKSCCELLKLHISTKENTPRYS
jgi:hypothetical protein